MKTPSAQELIRALYNMPAYRGSTGSGQHAKWWAKGPKLANEFVGGQPETMNPRTPPMPGAHVIPGQLNTEGFLEIGMRGQSWSAVPRDQIPPDVLAELTKYNPDASGFTADMIGEAAERLGYPGVTFKDAYDNGVFDDQYYVADKTRRRSRFARFEDPNSDDIMASLLLSLLGGGSAAGLLSQQSTDQNTKA